MSKRQKKVEVMEWPSLVHSTSFAAADFLALSSDDLALFGNASEPSTDGVDGADGDGDLLSCFELVLKKRTAPTRRSRENQLLLACERGHAMWVSILLDLGVNPNCVESGGGARDDALAVEETSAEEDGGSGSGSGWPADYFGLLHAARRREPCYEAIVASLLSAGADVNKQVAGKGYSAIYVAAQEGSTRILESLLAAGGDYTLRCHRGYVALHVAAQYGHADAVAALLRAVSFLALNSMTVYLTNIMI